MELLEPLILLQTAVGLAKSKFGTSSTPYLYLYPKAAVGVLYWVISQANSLHPFRSWRIDGTWVSIHDRLREWVRVDNEREASPSEVIVDSQSVKTAAMVAEAVGCDAAKQIKGRKRHPLTVGYLGHPVLRVFVSAANVGERKGAKRVLKRVKRMGKAVSRVHTVWVDGGL